MSLYGPAGGQLREEGVVERRENLAVSEFSGKAQDRPYLNPPQPMSPKAFDPWTLQLEELAGPLEQGPAQSN